ncbi:iron complex outermembrane receptor protein [Oxalobacteraceae bacterium GrIS 1.18]
MKNENYQYFAKTVIALAVGLAFSSYASAQAVANNAAPAAEQEAAPAAAAAKPSDASDSAVNTVVISGTRASLAKSLEIKRNADIVLDSISATELGRFPDDDVADSLSHINGISITRTTGGDGQYVNVRGLGPGYNVVTINNRIMATDDDSRDVAFDVFPSDLISGADVLKSAQASALEGSIGGTINLKTASPFDNPGFHAAARIEDNYNDMSYLTGPKLSAVISNTSEDRKFGAILGLVHSDTKLRTDKLDYNTYDANNPGTWPVDGGAPVVAACCIAFGAIFDDKKRDAVSGAFEWRPNNEFKLVADMMITRLNDPQIGYNQAYYPDFVPDTWKNVTVKNGYVTGMAASNFVPEFANITTDRVVNTSLFGLNGSWKYSPSLTLVGDIYRSKASRPEGGKDTFVVAGIGGVVTPDNPSSGTLTWSNNHDALPSLSVALQNGQDLATGLAARTLGNSDFQPHYIGLNGYNIEDKVTGTTLDGAYALDEGFVDHLKFGVAYTDRSKSRDDISNDWDNGSNQYANLYGNTSNINFGQLGNNVVSITSLPNFMHGAGGSYPTALPQFSVPAYLNALKKLDGTPNTQAGVPDGTVYNLASTLPALNKTNSYKVSEKTVAAYVEATMSGEKWNSNVGLRLIKTETTASTYVNNILSIYDPTPEIPTSSPQVNYSAPTPTSSSGSYVKPLPSANFSYWLRSDLQLRLGAAEVMARPSLNQLAPTQTDNTINRVYTIYRSGNADLKPITAFQQDISLEWYYQPKSALTAAVFGKQIKNFITTQVLNDVDIGVPGHLYSIQQPINGDRGDVLGLELGFQHLFDNGFGVNLQYTHMTTKAYVSGQYVGALEGITPTSATLGLLYEKGPISTSLSWNWTSAYIAQTFTEVNGVSVTADPFLWVTASASYEINKNFKVYVEGKNLSDAVYKSYLGNNHDEIYGYTAYGREFKVGVAGKF